MKRNSRIVTGAALLATLAALSNGCSRPIPPVITVLYGSSPVPVVTPTSTPTVTPVPTITPTASPVPTATPTMTPAPEATPEDDGEEIPPVPALYGPPPDLGVPQETMTEETENAR